MKSFLNCSSWRGRDGDGAGCDGGLGSGGAEHHVPPGSSTARQEGTALKLFRVFVLPCRCFHCSSCCQPLAVLVNSSVKQPCDCTGLAKGATATEPPDNTYIPASVRILLWLFIIGLRWLERSPSWQPLSPEVFLPHFPIWVFLLLLQGLQDCRGCFAAARKCHVALARWARPGDLLPGKKRDWCRCNCRQRTLAEGPC